MYLYFVATRALLFTLNHVEFVGCHCCLTEDFILSSSLDRPNAASEVSSLSSLLSLATFLLLRFLFFHLHYKSNSNYNPNLGLLNHEVSEALHQLAVLPPRLHLRDRRLNPDSGWKLPMIKNQDPRQPLQPAQSQQQWPPTNCQAAPLYPYLKFLPFTLGKTPDPGPSGITGTVTLVAQRIRDLAANTRAEVIGTDHLKRSVTSPKWWSAPTQPNLKNPDTTITIITDTSTGLEKSHLAAQNRDIKIRRWRKWRDPLQCPHFWCLKKGHFL